MKNVDIFLIISSRSPGRTRKAWYRYILVCGRHTLDKKEQVLDTTGHRLLLCCMVAALRRMRAPALITIHTDSRYLADGQGRLAGWKENGWCRADGKALKNADLWKQVEELLREHAVRFRVECMDLYKEKSAAL